MTQIKSKTDTNSDVFKKNEKINIELVSRLNLNLQEVSKGGPQYLKEKNQLRGKLSVRERINALIDTNTPFLELSPLASWEMFNNEFPSAGIITGIGMVHGIETMIIANDATVKGGTYIYETIKKHLRAQEIALQNSLPCIYLVDSGGIFLPEQARVFPDNNNFGRIFYNQARMSACEIPQISVVLGSCTAGGAYIPAMSDETIIVRDQGTIFLAGPPLVKAATGEDVTPEELGGALVHTSVSGVADYLAENDYDALSICRNIFENMPRANKFKNNLKEIKPPGYSPLELYGIIPAKGGPWPDVREIVARLTDGSEFLEFKKNYGKPLVTGFARIYSYEVGILASDGIMFSDSALKGTHFIQLCNSRGIPMIFLQNVTGFMVGKEYENSGIAKDGAKMVNALSNSNAPFFTIIIGGSYGAGNYAMGGRAFGPRFLFMWPNARISVMGATQAAQVLSAIKKDKNNSNENNLNDEGLLKLEKEIIQKYETEGSPYYSTARLWDDGIIDPAKTRDILGLIIELSQKTKKKKANYGVFRM